MSGSLLAASRRPKSTKKHLIQFSWEIFHYYLWWRMQTHHSIQIFRPNHAPEVIHGVRHWRLRYNKRWKASSQVLEQEKKTLIY